MTRMHKAHTLTRHTLSRTRFGVSPTSNIRLFSLTALSLSPLSLKAYDKNSKGGEGVSRQELPGVVEEFIQTRATGQVRAALPFVDDDESTGALTYLILQYLFRRYAQAAFSRNAFTTLIEEFFEAALIVGDEIRGPVGLGATS